MNNLFGFGNFLGFRKIWQRILQISILFFKTCWNLKAESEKTNNVWPERRQTHRTTWINFARPVRRHRRRSNTTVIYKKLTFAKFRRNFIKLELHIFLSFFEERCEPRETGSPRSALQRVEWKSLELKICHGLKCRKRTFPFFTHVGNFKFHQN